MSEFIAQPASPVMTEAYLNDPNAVIRSLREEDPLHFIPGPDFWLATRHEDVRELFTHPDFTNDPRTWDRYTPPPAGTFRAWTAENGLFAAAPEAHARLRRLVSAALTPRAVKRMERQVSEVVEQFAQPLRGRTGVVDLIAEFTDPIPNAVISRITGVPPKGEDDLRFRQLAQDSIRGFFAFADKAVKEAGDKAAEELAEYCRMLAETRRREPREDLVTDMVRARDDNDAFSDNEIVSMITALISAGSETTALGGTFALRALLRHPAELQKLRADPSLLDNAVNEVLRYDFGIGGGLPRYAMRDTELRGKTIRKGQMVQLSFNGAHRDPRVFEDPERFDVTRDCKDLVIFGRGAHYCLGANLARQEMRFMIEAALDFLPLDAHIREDEIAWTQIAFFKRMNSLPVDFG